MLPISAGSVEFNGCEEVEEFSLPSLTEIGGSLYINSNDSLVILSAPLLESLGSTLTIRDNPDLTTVELDSLSCVSDFTIEGNDMSADDKYALLVHLSSGC